MKISEVDIQLVKPSNGLIGFASLVIDESIYLGSIGIFKKLNEFGYRITYPTKKSGDKDFNLYHPITKEASLTIEQAIFNQLKILGL